MLRRDAAYAWKRLRYQYNTEFRQSILDHAKVYYENKATRRKLLRAVHRFEIRKQKNIITISDIQGASTKDFKGMVDSIIKGDAAYQPMAS